MRRTSDIYSFFVRIRAFFLICFILLAFLISGCSGARLSDAAWQDQGLNIVFPHPPERARIKLLKVIDGPQAVVEKSRGAMSKLLDRKSVV